MTAALSCNLKKLNICCFVAVAYTTLYRLRAVFLHIIISMLKRDKKRKVNNRNFLFTTGFSTRNLRKLYSIINEATKTQIDGVQRHTVNWDR